MLIFANYMSSNTPKEVLTKYTNQHLLFHSTVRYNQPEAYVCLLRGSAGTDRFIEGLNLLKDFRETHQEPTLYMDNDCILMNPVDELFEYDFDVAVIYRYEHTNQHGPQRCLGGFLFFSGRRFDKERQFLDNLILKTEEHYVADKTEWWYDQTAVSSYVGAPSVQRQQFEYHYAIPYEPCVKIVDGVKVLFLSANVWACPRAFYVPPKIILYHYNHHLWLKRNEDIIFPSGSVKSSS